MQHYELSNDNNKKTFGVIPSVFLFAKMFYLHDLGCVSDTHDLMMVLYFVDRDREIHD